MPPTRLSPLKKELCMAAIYPSLISGNLLNLQQEINRLAPASPGFHIDVMDNHFVPNLTWGPAFINALEKSSPIPLWVHAMVDNAQSIIDAITLRPGSIF
jgi:ribulose-phosphate 3-epimerase